MSEHDGRVETALAMVLTVLGTVAIMCLGALIFMVHTQRPLAGEEIIGRRCRIGKGGEWTTVSGIESEGVVVVTHDSGKREAVKWTLMQECK